MSGITFIFIILMFIYIIKGNEKLNFYIQTILKSKINYKSVNTSSNELIKNEERKSVKIQPIIIYYKTVKKNKIKDESKVKKSLKSKGAENKIIRNNKDKPLRKKNINFPPKKRSFIFSLNNNNKNRNSSNKIKKFSCKSQVQINVSNIFNFNNKKEEINKFKKNKELNINTRNINKKHSEKTKNLKIQNKKTYLEEYKIKFLNDEEFNNLEYEIALAIDKRTFFHYYFSLLKKKQLILFTFCPSNDYNLMSIKISLLFLSFSLYFTINGFFFSDSTMNKINEDKGEYNFIFQIPQILYSTLVSSIINMILKKLSLSEKQILKIKLEKNVLIAQEKANNIKTCLKIKLISFSILSFILMVFFWYFISAFCSVYKNTQIILIKDTLISFTISMIYPFGLNLFPGMFRIPALRDEKKNKKCLYKVSRFIALI